MFKTTKEAAEANYKARTDALYALRDALNDERKCRALLDADDGVLHLAGAMQAIVDRYNENMYFVENAPQLGFASYDDIPQVRALNQLIELKGVGNA